MQAGSWNPALTSTFSEQQIFWFVVSVLHHNVPGKGGLMCTSGGMLDPGEADSVVFLCFLLFTGQVGCSQTRLRNTNLLKQEPPSGQTPPLGPRQLKIHPDFIFHPLNEMSNNRMDEKTNDNEQRGFNRI